MKAKNALKLVEKIESIFKLAIELQKLQKPPIPSYKKGSNDVSIVNLADVKGKTFQEVWDEINPKDIIKAIENNKDTPFAHPLSEDVRKLSRFQQKINEAIEQSKKAK
jgi:hypothetical protein